MRRRRLHWSLTNGCARVQTSVLGIMEAAAAATSESGFARVGDMTHCAAHSKRMRRTCVSV